MERLKLEILRSADEWTDMKIVLPKGISPDRTGDIEVED